MNEKVNGKINELIETPMDENYIYKALDLVDSIMDDDAEENKVPACSSCNIQKGSLPLESFRNKISGFINSLNQYHTQYAVAKRYGLIEEKPKEVIFWFEQNIDQ